MSVQILIGDCREKLREMPDQSVDCCVTSPPYFGLRDYGVDGQMGLEATPDDFVAGMVAVFREVRRVLRDDGTLWLNIGDSYVAPRGNTEKRPGHDGKAVHDGLNYKGTRRELFYPDSIAFDAMSQDEFEPFYEAAVAAVRRWWLPVNDDELREAVEEFAA